MEATTLIDTQTDTLQDEHNEQNGDMEIAEEMKKTRPDTTRNGTANNARPKKIIQKSMEATNKTKKNATNKTKQQSPHQ